MNYSSCKIRSFSLAAKAPARQAGDRRLESYNDHPGKVLTAFLGAKGETGIDLAQKVNAGSGLRHLNLNKQ